MERPLTVIAIIVAAIIAIAFPLGHYVRSVKAEAAVLRTEALINARLASLIIASKPDAWQDETRELTALLSLRTGAEHVAESRTILDATGKLVAQSRADLATPLLTETADVHDATRKVGTLVISRSLRPILESTFATALLSLLLAMAAFLSLRVLPARTVRRAVEQLVQERERRQEVESALNVAAAKEVALQLAAAAELGRQQATLRAVIDALPDLIAYKDPKGNYLGCNAAFGLAIGTSTAGIIGKTDIDLIDAERAAIVRERDHAVLRTLAPSFHEEWLTFADGKKHYVELLKTPFWDHEGVLIGVASVARDLTERKNLEAQLRQSQKMDAVGRLAGGVAHDFNNLLTVISGYSDQLLESPGLDPKVREPVLAISQASARAATLTRQLLGFSRKTIMQPQVLDLNTVVTQTVGMLRRLIGEDIALTTVLAPDIAPVLVDPGQLDQVLLNLAVNARDAMPRGGSLTIETLNVQLDEDYAAAHLDCKPGPHVMLAVTDSGEGMAPDVLARIFEPFFTTKAVGAGTGLGLPMVLGIVQQSEGSIHVYSEPGHGSTFKIYFPAVARTLTMQPEPEAPAATPGTETVLLVEDEEALRKVALASLSRQGYRVLTAIDGQDALQVLHAQHGLIDLVLTDVVMPRMSGPALAENALARWPGVKVLFMSGYTDAAVVRHGLLHGEVSFIQKPFTQAGLARKVRQVLDATRDADGTQTVR